MKFFLSILLFLSTVLTAQEIDIVRRYNAVCDKDNYDILQKAINDHPGVTIVIPKGYNILIKAPLILPSDTKLKIDGTLKLTSGVVRNITQDAALGDTVIYVDNSDNSYLVGQYVSLSSDAMPTGGGGSVSRKLGETSRIVSAYANRIVLKDPLISNIQNNVIGGFLVSQNSKIGHTQSVLMMQNVRNISITGNGTIDGSYPTMYNVHPNSNDPTYQYFRFEEIKGGNGISAINVNNLTVEGITLKETNIAGVTYAYVDTFSIKNVTVYNTFMKQLAFTVVNHGIVDNVNLLKSYNEDGLSLHDNVYNSSFSNMVIKNSTRIGMLVGAGSKNNTFRNISIDSCNLSLYCYVESTQDSVHDNHFSNVSITNGVAGVTLGKCHNMTFDTLTVSYNSNSNHCITIGGQCHDITFNGGGSYDTKLLNRNGYGFRSVPKETYHLYESYNISFNHYSFVRLKKGISDTGNFPVIFNQCTFSNNADDGDIASPDFTINN